MEPELEPPKNWPAPHHWIIQVNIS